jgi:hypothetical protein
MVHQPSVLWILNVVLPVEELIVNFTLDPMFPCSLLFLGFVFVGLNLDFLHVVGLERGQGFRNEMIYIVEAFAGDEQDSLIFKASIRNVFSLLYEG